MTMFGVKARSMCVLAVGVALGVALRPGPAAAWGVKRSGKTWAKRLLVGNDNASQNSELDPVGTEGLGKRVLRHSGTGANEILHSTGRVL